MRLTDLSPKWLTPNVFTFRSPAGHKDWLTCKNVVMGHKEQVEIAEKAYGEVWGSNVVLCQDACAWNFSGTDFNTLSVTPSLDASASGNWHGYITNGEIVGGLT